MLPLASACPAPNDAFGLESVEVGLVAGESVDEVAFGDVKMSEDVGDFGAAPCGPGAEVETAGAGDAEGDQVGICAKAKATVFGHRRHIPGRTRADMAARRTEQRAAGKAKWGGGLIHGWVACVDVGLASRKASAFGRSGGGCQRR